MEAAGVLLIVFGVVIAAIGFIRRRKETNAYGHLRATLGRAILLGLELLVAADINTVAIEPSLQSLAILAGIILIRTFLSLSLKVEIEAAGLGSAATNATPNHHEIRPWCSMRNRAGYL